MKVKVLISQMQENVFKAEPLSRKTSREVGFICFSDSVEGCQNLFKQHFEKRIVDKSPKIKLVFVIEIDEFTNQLSKLMKKFNCSIGVNVSGSLYVENKDKKGRIAGYRHYDSDVDVLTPENVIKSVTVV